jgi:outer membrane immunogenic protein
MRRTLAIAIATAAISGPALAADIAVRAPVVARSPVYNWTGIYVGVNGGGAWGQQDPFNVITNRFDNFSGTIKGGMVGGTVGAQIQMAHVVLGFEADIDWANITGSTNTITPTILGQPAPFAVNASTKIPWIMTYRSRLGYAQDNWLVYATAGAAVMGNRTDLTTSLGTPCGTFTMIAGTPGVLNCNGTKTRVGAALGGGVEVGLTQAWSLKAEYLYVAAASLELSKINEVRVGLNYRFGGY